MSDTGTSTTRPASPYNMSQDLTLRGLALREAVEVVAAVAETMPKDFYSPTQAPRPVVTMRRTDDGAMGTDASRRYTVTVSDASLRMSLDALDRLRQTLDSYQQGDDGAKVTVPFGASS